MVGIGDDGLDGLSPSARAVIDHADLVVGGARHLAMLPDDDQNNSREKMSWPSPFIDGIKKIYSDRTISYPHKFHVQKLTAKQGGEHVALLTLVETAGPSKPDPGISESRS